MAARDDLKSNYHLQFDIQDKQNFLHSMIVSVRYTKHNPPVILPIRNQIIIVHP